MGEEKYPWKCEAFATLGCRGASSALGLVLGMRDGTRNAFHRKLFVGTKRVATVSPARSTDTLSAAWVNVTRLSVARCRVHQHSPESGSYERVRSWQR